MPPAMHKSPMAAGTDRNRFRRVQRRPGLISGFLAQTGLTLDPGTTVDQGSAFQPA